MASTVGQAAADRGANGNYHSLPGVQVIHLNPICCRPLLRSATIAVFGMKPMRRGDFEGMCGETKTAKDPGRSLPR